MVAFLSSLVATGLMLGICIAIGRRRPPGTELTWGEAFVAATFVFMLMLLAYGVVPNQWLAWADNELKWRKDAFFFGNGIAFFGRGRIEMPKEVVRDLIASVIYVVALVAHVKLWMWWQARGRPKPAVEQPRSAFGRPLVRKVEA